MEGEEVQKLICSDLFMSRCRSSAVRLSKAELGRTSNCSTVTHLYCKHTHIHTRHCIAITNMCTQKHTQVNACVWEVCKQNGYRRTGLGTRLECDRMVQLSGMDRRSYVDVAFTCT